MRGLGWKPLAHPRASRLSQLGLLQKLGLVGLVRGGLIEFLGQQTTLCLLLHGEITQIRGGPVRCAGTWRWAGRPDFASC